MDFVNFVDKQISSMVLCYKCSRGGRSCLYGEMSERLKEPVLKTGDVKASVGSNPTLSATSFNTICRSTQEAEGAPLLRE